MIRNISSIEIDHKEKKYVLICDQNAPVHDVREVLAMIDQEMIAIIDKFSQEQKEEVKEELPEGCAGKILC